MWPGTPFLAPVPRRSEAFYIREIAQEGKVGIHNVPTEDSMGKRFVSMHRQREFRRAGHVLQYLA